MRRWSAARRAALPLVVLLLALHVRSASAGDSVLQKLWAKAPPRAPQPQPQAQAQAQPHPQQQAQPQPQPQPQQPQPEAGAPNGAGAAAPGGADPRVAGAAGVAGTGALTAAAARWVPNTRKRGRPKGSKNKMPRAKRGRGESTASTALSDAARARLPGARGPPPGARSARWSPELKGYALAMCDKRNGELTATVKELVRLRPQDYGRGRAICTNGKPAAALSTELLRKWVAKRDAAPQSASWFPLSVGGKRAGAGRHRLLPPDIMARIISAWSAVLATKKTLFTSLQLRAVAVGVIVSAGYKDVLSAKHSNGTPVFSCSRVWVAKQCAAQGWRFKKPFGDSDKPPANMNDLIRDYLHRLAYFVKVYDIPKELVINADHSGAHYTQIKGGGWTADADTPGVASGGDKRELTAVPCSSAAGRVCPMQVVVGGSTALSMAQKIGKYTPARAAGGHLRDDYKGYGGQLDEKTVPAELAVVPKWIKHFAGTSNHWSDLVTSIDILVYVLVPFLVAEKARCGFAADKHAVLILDLWWGWISPVFKAYVREHYPWIHLVYVPGRCTPWAQPADRGLITRLKAYMRKYSAQLITDMVVHQLFGEGRPPTQVDVDIKGATTCKTNLAKWLAQACEDLSKEPALVQSYWSGIGVKEGITTAGLLDAWDPAVQNAAWERRAQLFKNLAVEEDPLAEDADGNEPAEGASAGGFGDEEPGAEGDLQTAGVLKNPGAAAAVSHEEAVAFLDDFVARLDARMAAAKTPLPTADNLAAVIAEVTANADAAASLLASDAEESDEESDEEVDEDEDEEEGEDEEEEEGATGGGGAGACGAAAPADVAGGAPGNPA
jgi:hypothetical protein